MSNGRMDEAQLELLKKGPADEKLDYVVTCVFETRKAVDAVPAQITVAIRKQRKADVRNVAVLCTVIATIISLATPILLHFV